MIKAIEWRLILICLLVTLVVSGLSSQVGIHIGPIADEYNVEPSYVSSQFSFLTGGMLLGTMLSFVMFNYISVRRFISTAYSIIFLAACGLYFAGSIWLISVILGLIGVLSGVGLCVGVSLISQRFSGKRRRTILVAQDAAYNLAGALFPFIAGIFIANEYHWSWGYIAVGVFALAILALVVVKGPGVEISSERGDRGIDDWSYGVVSAGVCLFLLMLAQIGLVVWLPQHSEQAFGVGREVSGKIITNIYTSALVGSFIAVYIVYRVRIQYFLPGLVTLTFICIVGMVIADDYGSLLAIAIPLGLSISATYNSLIAYGLLFVAQPKHNHVTFLVVAAGLGAAAAPYVSGQTVEYFSSTLSVLILAATLYALVILILFYNQFWHVRNIPGAPQTLSAEQT